MKQLKTQSCHAASLELRRGIIGLLASWQLPPGSSFATIDSVIPVFLSHEVKQYGTQLGCSNAVLFLQLQTSGDQAQEQLHTLVLFWGACKQLCALDL